MVVRAQRERDVEARREDRRAQVLAQRAGERDRGRSPADRHQLVVGDQRRGAGGDGVAAGLALVEAVEEARLAGERAHRAAVDALERADGLELVQVAPDRVDRDVQLLREDGGHHPAVALEPGDDRGLSFLGEVHAAHLAAKPHESRRNRQKAAG